MRFVVVGAAGQARELRWYLRATGHECVGFVLGVGASPGPHDSLDHVLGDEQWLEEHRDAYDALTLGIGNPGLRCRIADRLRARLPGVSWPPVIHSSAVFDASSVAIGDGVMVGANATMTVNVSLGELSLVNFGASIGHESRVGRGSVINPGANVSGGVTIGDGVLVGAGAVILQYLKIGDGARVGAGAVVTHDVPAGATVVGVPARRREVPA